MREGKHTEYMFSHSPTSWFMHGIHLKRTVWRLRHVKSLVSSCMSPSVPCLEDRPTTSSEIESK